MRWLCEKFRLFFVLGGVLLLGLSIYARWIEPNWLQVNRFGLAESVASPLKVAHLSDLHLRSFGSLEREILESLSVERPDAIFITGDTASESGNLEAGTQFLKKLSAPLGVYAVKGNWEYWNPSSRDLASSPKITLLVNESRRLREDVWVVGLDDAIEGHPEPGRAFSSVPSDAFCIVLFHSPAYFPEIAGRCPLALAGHTHGGQIRLPLLPPLWLPEGSGQYVEGWYQAQGSSLYVSRGVGTSIVPVRFLSRPEIVYLSIKMRKSP